MSAGQNFTAVIVDEARRERDRRWENLAFLLYLEGLLAFGLCSMSSRPAVFVVPCLVNYDSRSPRIESARRFSSARYVEDCYRWATWLGQALAVTRPGFGGRRVPVPLAEVAEGLPKPEPTDFYDVRVWPTLAGEERV